MALSFARLRNCAVVTHYLRNSATTSWLSLKSYEMSGLSPRLYPCQPSLCFWVGHPPPSSSDIPQAQKQLTPFQAYTQPSFKFPQLRKLCTSTKAQHEFQLAYTAPLKGAVRAIKVFSLCTAVAAFFGSPVLVWCGNPSVPAAARVAIGGIVMLAGLSTTAILHWILKGYVLRLHFNQTSQAVAVDTLSVLARKKTAEFHVSEAQPPPNTIGFHTFQAKGKPFFLHTEVFEDKKLLSALLGAKDTFAKKQSTDTNTQN